MELATFNYIDGKGWSVKTFPDLDSDNTLIIAFGASEFIDHPELFQELAKHYPNSKMIGCSTAGEILTTAILDHSISVAIMRFKNTKIKVAKQEIKSFDQSNEAGTLIAKECHDDTLRGILVLSDGLNVNGSELVRAFNETLNKDVVITGGLAGDGSRFKKTWAIYNGTILENTIVCAAFYGEDISLGHASRGGWDIFGPERRITRSHNNILYELDDRPALALYKEYLGERASELPASGLLFPMAIRQDDNDTRQFVRTILATNEEDQSLTFAGDMPVGYYAQLMRANFDRLITSAGEAGEQAINVMFKTKKQTKGPVLAVAISCVGRRLLLAERTEEETESLFEMLPPHSQQIGFYSYGELSPYSTGECRLHNQTMTLTTFFENDSE